MFRISLMFVVLAAAASLRAQSVGSPITGSFNTDNVHVVRMNVDYGATPQALTLDIDVLSLAGPTFLFEWIDWDGYVAGLSGVSQSAQVMPAGNATAQLITPARSGVHPFVLRMDNFTMPGQVVDFAATLTLSAGSMVSYTESDRLFNTLDDPYRQLEGDLAANFVTNSGSANLDTWVELLFGPTAQGADLRFDCSAQGVQNMIVSWQASGGDGQLVVNADANGDIPYMPAAPIRVLSIAPSSGPVVIRVIIRREPDFANADWTISVPGTIAVNHIAGPGMNDAGSPDDDGCAARGGGQIPAVLGLAALLAITRRRRTRAADC